jgi:3-(3-hydroxy-phenyl)propionate hydroxylase
VRATNVSVGIADEFAAITRPAHGLRLIAPDMRVLTEFHRDVAAGRHGYPKANMFDQPELERLLRANLTRHPGVTLRGNAEVTGLVQDGAGHVRVDLVDRTTGETETLLADYVLGCDGANSVARTAIGSGMHDLNLRGQAGHLRCSSLPGEPSRADDCDAYEGERHQDPEHQEGSQ